MMAESTDSAFGADPQLLEKIVQEFMDGHRRGERSGVEEYAQKYPDLSDELREVLPALLKLDALAPHGANHWDSTPSIERGHGHPERLGDYRIVQEVGRGGMGVVYEAVEESLGRRVALKVLPPQITTDKVQLERFRREAQAAARIEHPHIVPVFGVGQHDNTHFYAMPFIEGQGLDRVLAELRHLRTSEASSTGGGLVGGESQLAGCCAAAIARRLATGTNESSEDPRRDAKQPVQDDTVRVAPSATTVSGASSSNRTYFRNVARIGLHVSEALSFAHGQRVLHRDIKPSNVLLDATGAAHVTDFGLAKIEDSDDLTHTGDVVGTLRYMAPERLRGWSDPRSDVYGVGLTLYECVTLRPAFDEKDRSRLIQQLTKHEPPRPRRFDPRVPRDLETIILKAMNKEPAQRYATAEALAEDLRRFLAGEPILARRATAAERTWLWARRNPVVAGLTATALVLLVSIAFVSNYAYVRTSKALALEAQQRKIALAALAEQEKQRRLAEEHAAHAQQSAGEAARQRDRAEANFRRAREAVDEYFTFISENTLLDVPTLKTVRMELLARAHAYYEDFVAQRKDDPTLQAELAASYLRLAFIAVDMGRDDWLPLVEKAVDILERLDAQGVQFARFRSWRHGVYNVRVPGIRVENPVRALDFTRRGIAIWEKLHHTEPGEAGFRADLSALHLIAGMLNYLLGRPDDALLHLRHSRDLRGQLVDQHPDQIKYQYALAEVHIAVGMALLSKRETAEAQHSIQAGCDRFETLVRENPLATRIEINMAYAYQQLAAAHLQADRPLDALGVFNNALRIQERLARDYPGEAELLTTVAQSYRILGRSLYAANQQQPAEEAYAKAFKVLDTAIREYPDETAYKDALAAVHHERGLSLQARRRYEEAEKELSEALAIRREVFGGEHRQVANSLYRLAILKQARGRHAKADALYQETLAIRRKALGHAHPSVASTLYAYAKFKHVRKRYDEAETMYREALAAQRGVYGKVDPRVAMTLYRLGQVQHDGGKFREAEAPYRQSLDIYRSLYDDEHEQTAVVQRRLAQLLRDRGDDDAIDKLYTDDRSYRSQTYGIIFGDHWDVKFYGWQPSSSQAPLEDWHAVVAQAPLDECSPAAIDFRWERRAPCESVAADYFATVTTGTVELSAGEFELHVVADNGVRVLIDDRTVIDQWQARPAPKHVAELSLDGGAHAIRVEHFEIDGNAELRLWLRPVN